MNILYCNNSFKIQSRLNAAKSDTQRYKGVSFQGHAQTETLVKKGFKRLIHQTAFFREPETNNLVWDYLTNTFGKDDSIKILSGACSTGEEVVTQSMLSYAIKDKVEIIGIDLGKKAIEQAKSRRYVLENVKKQSSILTYFDNIENSPFSDNYLLTKGNAGLSAQQQYNKRLFNEFFEPTGEKLEAPFWKKVCRAILKNSLKTPPLEIEKKAYRLKDGMAENCRFIEGDIYDVEKLTNNEKFNAIFFKNAMYHLTTKDVPCGMRIPKENSEEIVENLITILKGSLKDKGLIVFGEKEPLQMGDAITVPKVMKKLGFMPMNKTSKHEANVWKKS